jgi:hypothetical protein
LIAARPQTPREFFSAVRERFERAAARAGLVDRRFSIGGREVLLRFAGGGLHGLLTPALEHLASLPGPRPALTVLLFDTVETGVAPPPPAWTSEAFGPRGEIGGFNDGRIHTAYQQGSDVLLMYDRERSEALYWSSDPAKVPYWERSFPLRTILHWWLQDQPLQPVHAAAVGLPQGGVLIAGQSGAGKSTAALACLDSGLLYAGDDYVLVGTGDAPHLYSLYGTAKLEPANLLRFPRLEAAASNIGRLDREKALLFLNSFAPEKLTPGFPLRAILVPRITGRPDTLLRRGKAGDAFLALAPTTLGHLPGAENAAFAKMAALVRRLPAYILEVGTDLPQIPRAILGLLRAPEAI